MRSIVLLSGGIDSTVLAYKLASESHQLHCLGFRYRQRNADRELAAARSTAAKLHAKFSVSVIGDAFGPSALTGSGDVPEVPTSDVDGTYPAVVPGRNLVFLAIAVAQALSNGVSEIYFAGHAGDAASFPDCRENFLCSLGSPLSLVAPGVCIVAPFIKKTKAEIVAEGERLGVPWHNSYSCYLGKAVTCKKCGACRARAEAFEAAGVTDMPHDHRHPAYVTL